MLRGWTAHWLGQRGATAEGLGWLWQVLLTGDSCFHWFKRIFIPTSQKRIFFLPCPERKMQKNVASLEETSARMGLGEELVFLQVL